MLLLKLLVISAVLVLVTGCPKHRPDPDKMPRVFGQQKLMESQDKEG